MIAYWVIVVGRYIPGIDLSIIYYYYIISTSMIGYDILAQALAKQGVQNTFGIVGKYVS